MLSPTLPSLEHRPHPTHPRSTEHAPLVVLSVPTQGTRATAPGRLLALRTPLMLPALGVSQTRQWESSICSHPERSTTSPTSRLTPPALRKALPWPLSGSSRQHSRSGAGSLAFWGGAAQCFSLGPIQL